MDLDGLTILNGIFSIIFCSIGIILGTRIVVKYLRYRRSELFYFSISAFFIVSPWYPSAISFIVALFNSGVGIPAQLYYFLGLFFPPISIFTWLIVFSDLVIEKQKKIILSLWAIFGVIFEVLLSILLIYDYNLIGNYNPFIDPINVRYSDIMIFSLGLMTIITVSTGFIFGRESYKSQIPETRLKGLFVSLGFLLYAIGGLIDFLIPLNALTLTVARTFLIACGFSFYIGIIAPEWAKNLLIKQ